MNRIFLATDHAGFGLKEIIKEYLLLNYPEYEIIDFGAYTFDKEDDYPDFIHYAAKAVSNSYGDEAIIFGGSGQGEAMVANRYRNLRAAVVNKEDFELVRLARKHNNSNVLSFGARFVSSDFAKEAVKIFLDEEFDFDSRHFRRIKKISNLPKYKILPAVLEKDLKSIKQKISVLSKFTDEFQIDISDGILTPYKTYPFSKIFPGSKSLKFLENYKIELHLMVNENLAFLDKYGDFGAYKIVPQIQSRDIEKTLFKLKNKGKYKLGVSVMPNTKPEEIEKVLQFIDYVQVMCIDEIGRQGSKFTEKALNLINEIKKAWPDLPVSADGGIKLENINSLKEAGVEYFAIGSAIYKSDNPKKAYSDLLSLL